MGSRNFKLLLGGPRDGEVEATLVAKEQVGLGQALLQNDGRFGDEDLARARDALGRFAAMGTEAGAKVFIAVGTEAVRSASNGGEILKIATELGFNAEVADERREAELAHLAVAKRAPLTLVTEMGSHSVELAWGPIGNVAYTAAACGYELAEDRFYAGRDSFIEARTAHRDALDTHLELPRTAFDGLIALSSRLIGSFVLDCDKDSAAGRTMTLAQLHTKIAEIDEMSPPSYAALRDRLPRREKILAGLVFLAWTMERIGAETMRIATADLGVGIMTEFLESNPTR